MNRITSVDSYRMSCRRLLLQERRSIDNFFRDHSFFESNWGGVYALYRSSKFYSSLLGQRLGRKA